MRYVFSLRLLLLFHTFLERKRSNLQGLRIINQLVKLDAEHGRLRDRHAGLSVDDVSFCRGDFFEKALCTS